MALLDLQGMELTEDGEDPAKRSRLSVVACCALSGLSVMSCV
jgi:hypothetical protein